MSTNNPDTPNIPEYIQQLADFIEAESTETKPGHYATPRDFLGKLLKSGPRNEDTPTIEEVRRVQRLESELVDATKLANGNRGIRRMKTEKDLDETHQRTHMTAGPSSRTIEDRFQRKGTARNVRTGEVTEFKGNSSTKISTVKGSKVSSFGQVKAYLRIASADL